MQYRLFERKHKAEAKSFIADMEMLVIFLNSPFRSTWLRMIGLKKEDIRRINKVVDHYAGRKVAAELKHFPKTRSDVIRLEDAVLREMFESKSIFIDHVVTGVKKFFDSRKFLEETYPGSAILDVHHLERLAVLAGSVEAKKWFPTSFVVFGPRNGKIVSVQLERHAKA